MSRSVGDDERLPPFLLTSTSQQRNVVCDSGIHLRARGGCPWFLSPLFGCLSFCRL